LLIFIDPREEKPIPRMTGSKVHEHRPAQAESAASSKNERARGRNPNDSVEAKALKDKTTMMATHCRYRCNNRPIVPALLIDQSPEKPPPAFVGP